MENSVSVLQSVKAAVLATLFSVVLALLLSVFLRFVPLSDKVAQPVCQVLKYVALSLGCALSIKDDGGWWKGLLAGAVFTALSFLSFSAFGGHFSLTWLIVVDLLLGLVVGASAGIASVNFRK